MPKLDGAGLAPRDHIRLARIDRLLELEYGGFQSTVDELAAMFGVDRRTLFRDLRVIEQARGAPVRLVRRRKKRTQ